MNHRSAVFALALLVLVGDLWTKAIAADRLASPRHPMVTEASDGSAAAPLTVAALLGRRGLDAAEVDALIGRRAVWRYGPLEPSPSADDVVDQASRGRSVLVLDQTAHPSPRRARPGASRGSEGGAADALTWRAALDEDFGVAPQAAERVLATSTLGPRRLVVDADAPVPPGERVVVLHRDVEVVPGFFSLVYAENPGAAWSLLATAPEMLRRGFFILVSLAAMVGLSILIWRGLMGTALSTWALGAVLGGAVGNLVDRVRYGVVIDFILNYIGDYRWPVYNVADIGISVGVALIFIDMLFLQRGQPAADTQAAAPGGTG